MGAAWVVGTWGVVPVGSLTDCSWVSQDCRSLASCWKGSIELAELADVAVLEPVVEEPVLTGVRLGLPGSSAVVALDQMLAVMLLIDMRGSRDAMQAASQQACRIQAAEIMKVRVSRPAGCAGGQSRRPAGIAGRTPDALNGRRNDVVAVRRSIGRRTDSLRRVVGDAAGVD